MGRMLPQDEPTGVVNRDQPPASHGKQREIPILGETRDIAEVPMELVRACRSEIDAINLCINLSGYADEFFCEKLHIDKGHFSRIRKGRGHFPTRKRVALMQLCGNAAPIQFEAWRIGWEATAMDKSHRIAALEQQIANLRRSA